MFKKLLSLTVTVCFFLTTLGPFPKAYAAPTQDLPQNNILSLTPFYAPLLVKGMTIHPENPFQFDFIVDTGKTTLSSKALNDEAMTMIKYFLASLTVPEKEMWVNLSPLEKNRIVPESFGQTDMGRDLLAQDYILKKLTASLIYPEGALGKKFWSQIYSQIGSKFGTTNVSVNTFNKVWIVPASATVYEHGNHVYVVNSHLKVMLESDYNAMQKLGNQAQASQTGAQAEMTKNIIRQMILPAIEKEVNEGEHFAALRQMYTTMILASWYKNKLKDSLLNQVYADKNKITGIDIADKNAKEKIYRSYIETFRKGVYNYIKEEVDPVTNQTVPKKYFSGGANLMLDPIGGVGKASALDAAMAVAQDSNDIVISWRGDVSAAKDEPSAEQAPADAAQTVDLPKNKDIPGFHNLKPGQLYLDKFSKLYPLTVSFLKLYGGNKPEYAILRELAQFMEQNNVDVMVGRTTDPYVDINSSTKQITLNSDFMDFLFKTGRKKIYMSFIVGAVLRLRDGKKVDTTGLELLVTGGKKSVFPDAKTRLDDTKKLYQLTLIVKANDTKRGSVSRKFLNDEDVLLVISDVLHRGKILDARRLREYLRNTFGYYGIRDISREKAGELLARFKNEHSDIVVSREHVVKKNIEQLKRKLEPNAAITDENPQENSETRTLTYSLKPAYIKDPAFKDRITIWDVEVERQDEVDFGGKVAHTGEMMYIPHIITLPNFSSSGATFQKLFEFNDIPSYLTFVSNQRQQLEQFIAEHSSQLDVLPGELPDEVEHELNALRVVIEDGNEKAIDQVRRTITSLDQVIKDLQGGSYTTLKDYFRSVGQALDIDVADIKKTRADLEGQVLDLNNRIKTLTDQKADVSSENSKLQQLNGQLDELQKRFERVSAQTASKLLVAARFLQVAPEISGEIKSNLRVLAGRIGIPLNRLLLAIRSSAVGEDSEEASFAGRQDTYIFQRPIAIKNDAEGLDNIIVSWVFNQASLFNKRAIDYRADQGLPTFDEHVEISTLFQQMFLSEKSFIGFSVDRESGAPLMSMSITEGQGELLVSGRESGSKFITSYDGTLLSRDKGDRKFQVVETRDGLNKKLEPIPERVRREFAITDQNVLKETAQYFGFLHDYYEGYIDTEGAYRIMRDEAGQIMYLHDPKTGAILRDQRGLPRYPWMIVSTQVRPETVFSSQDSDVVPLQRIVVTEAAFKKAEEQGLVLNYNFIAKTMGTAQGELVYVKDKSADSLASARDKIMLAEQSDPDMTSAMQSARGVIAVQGGPNSHTMIVAAEYDLVAMSGISDTKIEDIEKALPAGVKVTVDAEHGRLIIGVDHELAVAGKDFNVRDIPDTAYGGIRSSTIVASVNKAFRQVALSKIPSYKGIGLLRLELALSSIGIYPEYLLAYDNLNKKEQGQSYSGPVLDPVQDAEGIKRVEKAIEGYNSAEDYYVSVISEWVTAMAETLVAPQQEVIIRAQSILDPKLRLAVLNIVKDYYKMGLGYEEPLYALKRLLAQEVKKAQGQGAAVEPGSDIDILTKVIGLVDKRLYIRLDDRKSDEYGAVFGADRFVKDEVNPMKGYRGLDLMLRTPETLRWQLEALKKAADTHRSKMGIFAPVVRRPQDVKQLLTIMDEVGLTSKLVKRGIMTELPTNSINIDDFLATGIDFISTGGNDGLQTVGRVDRNTSSDALKKVVTAYSPSILRWNAHIITEIKKFFKATKKLVDAGFCGNDPSVKGQENYGVILAKLGYDSVSVIIDAFQAVATNLTRQDFKIPQEAQDAVGFDFKMNRNDLKSIRKPDFDTFDITKFRLGLGLHYRAFTDYLRLSQIIMGKGTLTDKKDIEIYQRTREILLSQGMDQESLSHPDKVLAFYQNVIAEDMEKAYQISITDGKPLVIALDNGFSYQYRKLPLGEFFEPHEPNADYGYQGLVRVLDKDKDFLNFELTAVKVLLARHGNKAVAILLRSVRSYKEIDALQDLLKEKQVVVHIAVDVDVTADIFEIKEILARNPSFVSILNPRQLTSDMIALEQNNANGLEITSDDVNYQLNRPAMIIATAAKDAGIPFYLDPSVHPTPMKADAAMAVKAQNDPLGGINFDAGMLNMTIKRDGQGMPLPVGQQPMALINIQGLRPVIINIQESVDVPAMLGLNKK